MNKNCSFCNSTKTAQWRFRQKSGSEDKEALCNRCGVLFIRKRLGHHVSAQTDLVSDISVSIYDELPTIARAIAFMIKNFESEIEKRDVEIAYLREQLDNEDEILICQGAACNGGRHLCPRLPLHHPAEDGWFCKDCNLSDQISEKRRLEDVGKFTSHVT
jgi:hypothetical protein